MKKHIFSFLIVIILVVCGVIIIRNISTQSDKTINVGVISFLTGEYATMGKEIVNGINLANDFNHYNYKINLEDGKGEAKTAVTAYNRMNIKDITAVIVAGANQVPAVAPLLVRDKIPTVATIIPNSNFLQNNKNETWLFRNFPSSAGMAEELAKYAIEKVGLKTVGMFLINAEIGDESGEAFKNSFQKFSGKVLIEEHFNENDNNLKLQIAKINSYSPEAIYIVGYGPGYVTAINQVIDSGFKGILLTNDAIASPESKNVNKNTIPIYYSINGEENNATNMAEILHAYKERYGEDMSVFAMYGYDSLVLLGNAIQKSSDANKNEIRNELLKIKNLQLLSGKFSFVSNGDCRLPATVKKMQ